MPLEFQPPTIEGLLGQEHGRRRLRNREGFVRAWDSEGNQVGLEVEGYLLDVHREAVLFELANPDHRIMVVENNCGHSGAPNS